MAHKTCNGCGTDTKAPASVPYVVHESTVARMERIIKRQWFALIGVSSEKYKKDNEV